jgi:hypothetical protein
MTAWHGKYSGIGSSKSATNIAGKTKPLAAMIGWRIAGDTQISGRLRHFRAMIARNKAASACVAPERNAGRAGVEFRNVRKETIARKITGRGIR